MAFWRDAKPLMRRGKAFAEVRESSWQSRRGALNRGHGRAGPVCRRAFARFSKTTKRDLLLAAIQVGFPKSPWNLVAFVSVLLSETAGAGNGLNRKSLHRRVKTKGQVLPFGSNLDGRSSKRCGRGQDVAVAP